MKFGQTLKASPFASANRLPSLALEYKALKKVIKRDDDFLPQLEKWVETLDAAFAAQARECLARAKPVLGAWLLTRQSNKVRRVPSRVTQDAASLANWARLSTIALRKIVKKFDKAHRAGDDDGARGRGAGATWLAARGAPPSFTASSALTELRALALLSPAGATLLSAGDRDANGENAPPGSAAGAPEADLLECGICMDTMYRPHTLACGHVFCEPCVRKAKETTMAVCPVCRSATLTTASPAPQTRQVLLTRCPARYEERRSELAEQRRAAVRQPAFHYAQLIT